MFDPVEHRHAEREVDIPRNFAWVGCLVYAASTGLGMIFENWISTNISPLWGWGAHCPLPKDQCHPSPALPTNGIDGEGERGGGFNRVLNHFEGRRPSPFQAHTSALRLWFPRPASEARGEDYGEGRSQTASAINEQSHFPKARRHPSPGPATNGIDGEGERSSWFVEVYKNSNAEAEGTHNHGTVPERL